MTRNKTQEATKMQVLHETDTMTKKIHAEFNEQINLVTSTFNRLQKACSEIKAVNKEDQIKNQIKALEGLLVKSN